MSSVFVAQVQAAFLSFSASHLPPLLRPSSLWLAVWKHLAQRGSNSQSARGSEALECFSLTAHCSFPLPSLMNHGAWNLPGKGSLAKDSVPRTGDSGLRVSDKPGRLRFRGSTPYWAPRVLGSGSGCSICCCGLGELITGASVFSPTSSSRFVVSIR